MGSLVVPKHLQIETVNGSCTARCLMCTIQNWTRKPRRMSEEDFEAILRKFVPYIQHLDYLTLHGCGEPLLDKGLSSKISIAKRLGFRGTGLATNCTELTEERAKQLLESGLDTIIFSIDGYRKETHEKIRAGTIFEEVTENARRFIAIRNQLAARTRVLVRFIRQELNFDEWTAFYEEWIGRVRPDKGDDVIRFDVHNWGGRKGQRTEAPRTTHDIGLVCTDLFERFIVYSDGNIGFCCADDNGFFPLGNVFSQDPIEIYNNAKFCEYRNRMLEGRIRELDICRDCTIMQSRLDKTNPRDAVSP